MSTRPVSDDDPFNEIYMSLYNQHIQIPAGMSILEAMSRGILPRNALVSAVNGASVGSGQTIPVDVLLSNSGADKRYLGVTPAPVSGGSPVSTVSLVPNGFGG